MSEVDWESSALILAWVAIAILALAVAGLLRAVRVLANRQSPERLHVGPSIGETLPTEVLASLNGSTYLVLFADASCGPCHTIAPALLDVASANGLSPILAVRADVGDLAESAAGIKQGDILSDQADVFSMLRISATPYAVVISPDSWSWMPRPWAPWQHLKRWLADRRSRARLARSHP